MPAVIHHQEQIMGLRKFGNKKEIIVTTTNSSPYRAFLIDANPAGDPLAPVPLLPDGVIGSNVGAVDLPYAYSPMYAAGSLRVQVKNSGNLGGHLLATTGGGGLGTVVMANKISANVLGVQTLEYPLGKVSAADVGKTLIITASGNMKNDGGPFIIKAHRTVGGTHEEIDIYREGGEAYDPAEVGLVRTQVGRDGDLNDIKALYINPETLLVDVEQVISHGSVLQNGPSTNVGSMFDVPDMAWASLGGEGHGVGFNPLMHDVGAGAGTPLVMQRVVNGIRGKTAQSGGAPYLCSVMATENYLALTNRESGYVAFFPWMRGPDGKRSGHVNIAAEKRVYLDSISLNCRQYVDRFDKFLYVIHLEGGNIEIIDLQTLKVAHNMTTKSIPMNIVWSLDGTKGFLGHAGDPTVYVIDATKPGVILDSFDTGVGAGKSNRHLTLTKDGVLYTASHSAHLISATNVKPILDGTGPAVPLKTWTLTDTDFTGLASPSTNPRNQFIMRTTTFGSRDGI